MVAAGADLSSRPVDAGGEMTQQQRRPPFITYARGHHPEGLSQHQATGDSPRVLAFEAEKDGNPAGNLAL